MFDIEVLKRKGFMSQDPAGTWRMKAMHELMDEDVKAVPKNILHMQMPHRPGLSGNPKVVTVVLRLVGRRGA